MTGTGYLSFAIGLVVLVASAVQVHSKNRELKERRTDAADSLAEWSREMTASVLLDASMYAAVSGGPAARAQLRKDLTRLSGRLDVLVTRNESVLDRRVRVAALEVRTILIERSDQLDADDYLRSEYLKTLDSVLSRMLAALCQETHNDVCTWKRPPFAEMSESFDDNYSGDPGLR